MSNTQRNPMALAIHGGCGVMNKADMPESEWQAARADLKRSLQAGWALLQRGASALDAVEAAVMVMEDSEHFNAGHGAALNTQGDHELDASIMDGNTLEAGAIAMARSIRNPICAARRLMHSGETVMLGASAADAFARQSGLPMVDQSYFTTDRRVKALVSLKAHAKAGTAAQASEAEKHGTVGAVALDSHGHLAAATSTGGFNNKPAGRIGDTAVIGAGTYARDGVVAVSGTGKGEFFIRHAVGHEIASRMRYLGENLDDACQHVIFTDLAPHQIGAGLVAVGADGSVTAPYNTAGMFRGWIGPDGRMVVASHDTLFEMHV
ncbi:beta-aspartyl-peptidase [Agrobacterium vitis]|uniref:Isoaspartyl peptidase n=1 Tax=Agrobacterium vitis TaxID=373 RepID=A0A368NKW9_AGRVI|nr:isoaspartyl peptidase/L-asparaginase [Agrobacterium vitis]KAA3509782.1 isoaspartyl peptidase/L-asparaginase [Agrobacterium vitis]KAA3523404.1 isoaspartyl peptidase/L-asparaginase [Agrobacterium vitis]MCF1479071.1 isoaspartyl peptidase/L-asparaginase [Agrobacterium vitis]MUO80267.1 beta-aspartyl-peptidase [Agrobacterium vitis]MUO94933.1 beta-aspartyl-peptidase [Agrobacterium vitis]